MARGRTTPPKPTSAGAPAPSRSNPVERAELRDVDWPLIEGALAVRPRVVESTSGSHGRLLLLSQKLRTESTLLGLGYAILEGLRGVVGLDRVALFLRSPSGRWLSGLVGTNLDGKLVDERHLRHAVDPTDDRLWADLRAGRRSFEAQADAPWVAHRGEETSVVGRGWFVRTPIVADGAPLGFLYNDSAITRAPFDPEKQELAATFLMLVSPQLRIARDHSVPRSYVGLPKLVSECLELLERNPSATNGALAKELGVSAHRLSREFEGAMGTSLLDHRNELRLERFFALVEDAEETGAPVSLVDVALDAGFGSYSQFHRVFSARFGRSPRSHLQT